jgi:hypothetical protein
VTVTGTYNHTTCLICGQRKPKLGMRRLSNGAPICAECHTRPAPASPVPNDYGARINCIVCHQSKPKLGARYRWEGHRSIGLVCRECQHPRLLFIKPIVACPV